MASKNKAAKSNGALEGMQAEAFSNYYLENLYKMHSALLNSGFFERIENRKSFYNILLKSLGYSLDCSEQEFELLLREFGSVFNEVGID